MPILAGGAGILLGPPLVGGPVLPGLDSHFRYLSGLLLGIGLGFAGTIPDIARHRRRFALLAAIVVLGGLGRAWSIACVPGAGALDWAALAMELGVTPALAIWQHRLSAPLHPTN